MNFSALKLQQERTRLHHPHAFHSARTRGRRVPEPDDGIRTCFERDGHRILHAKPFRRMRNKTQVFFSPENDHISTRMDHSLYVATISSTICRALGLNDDLAFAIALGHDLGHSPFGHSGEEVLQDLLNQDRPEGTEPIAYSHEYQSLRVVDLLAHAPGHGFSGLNLSYEVRDGIRCHCGESREPSIGPRPQQQDADPSTFDGRDTLPITLEGCVVRMADRIAYLGRDYEDAQTALGDSLPPMPELVLHRLGPDNRSIIASLVHDVITQNLQDPARIGFSQAHYDAMMALRDFNYRHIYGHWRLEEYRLKMVAILRRIYEVLFQHLVATPPERWRVAPANASMHLRTLAHFIQGAGYASLPEPSRVVVDFMALMTDGFAFKVFESVSLPEPIV